MAKYFRKVPAQNGDFHYVPCAPSDEGAFPTTMIELPEPDKLLPPEVCYDDYLLAIQKIKPTVNANDLKKQEEFTQEFGQEG